MDAPSWSMDAKDRSMHGREMTMTEMTPWFPRQRPSKPPLLRAIMALRERGHIVEAADIPGLWNVSGYPELTTNQVINIGLAA
jgi:hypothetical protein